MKDYTGLRIQLGKLYEAAADLSWVNPDDEERVNPDLVIYDQPGLDGPWLALSLEDGRLEVEALDYEDDTFTRLGRQESLDVDDLSVWTLINLLEHCQ